MSRTNKKSANRSRELALDRALISKLANMPALPSIPGKKRKGPNPSAMMRSQRIRGDQPGRRQGANRQFAAASSYATGQSGKAPIVIASSDACYIKHRELLMNVSGTGSTAFTLANTFALNPGVPATFPWLATQAQNWETYRFRKLRFCYYTRTGSTTVGSVMFVPDYDAADSAPGSESLASTFEDVQEDAPWKDICTPLRPVCMHQPGVRKYVRNGPLAANLDIKTYDSGNLFVFTVDSAAAAAWGKLWVEYEVDLYTPQTISSIPAGVAGGSFLSGGSTSGANPLGTTPQSTPQNSYISVDALSNVTFQKTGYYLIGVNVVGTVISGQSQVVSGGSVISTSAIINSTATSMTWYAIFNATSTGATYRPTATATTITSSELEVGSMPAGSGI